MLAYTACSPALGAPEEVLLLAFVSAGGIMSYVEFQPRRANVSSELHTVENERNYVARELHDSVAQTSQQIILQAGLCRKLLERRRLETLAEELANLEARAKHASQQVREFIADMRPPLGEPDAPFVDRVRAEIDTHLTRGGPPTEFEFLARQPVPVLPDVTCTALLRILQEALRNARKHAQAQHMSVTLLFEENRLRLAVKDDGRGFSPAELRARPPEASRAGFQLMRARAQSLGGEFKVQTGSNQGTIVEAIIPIK
jgi:signal transduction histidine kinase